MNTNALPAATIDAWAEQGSKPWYWKFRGQISEGSEVRLITEKSGEWVIRTDLDGKFRPHQLFRVNDVDGSEIPCTEMRLTKTGIFEKVFVSIPPYTEGHYYFRLDCRPRTGLANNNVRAGVFAILGILVTVAMFLWTDMTPAFSNALSRHHNTASETLFPFLRYLLLIGIWGVVAVYAGISRLDEGDRHLFRKLEIKAADGPDDHPFGFKGHFASDVMAHWFNRITEALGKKAVKAVTKK